MEDINKRAVEFFKNNKRYDRMLNKMGEKYKRRGNVEGSIELKSISEEEKLILCKIKPEFINSDTASFTVKGFMKVFKGTEFENMDLNEVVKNYFKNSLVTEKEQKETQSREREEFFTRIISEFMGTQGAEWLRHSLDNKNYGYILIVREYERDKENLRIVLKYILKGITLLLSNTSQYPRLAIFASSVTKDPHYFDTNAIGGKLLIAALSYMAKTDVPSNSEEENELLYGFRIIKDGISNFTTCSGIKAYKDKESHRGIEGFVDSNEPVQLNLYNLSMIDFIECSNNEIYVFENPSVFSEIFERTMHFNPSLLCTSGQLKLASIVFLDKLADGVRNIYYSGDLDPEGINIAYKLRRRYGDKLKFWRYDLESYNKAKSRVKFEPSRYKQLENIDCPELGELIKAIGESGCSGYQELLLEDYLRDMGV